MKVSDYVSYKEVTHSNTAVSRGIENYPSEDQLILIEYAAKKVFDPLREWVGGPVKINSVFRSAALNKAIGGSNSSQHSVGLDPIKNSYGAAFDIDDDYYWKGVTTKSNADMFHYIKDNLDFDQLIWEFGTNENPKWVHFSFRPDGKNRKEVLKALKKGGRTMYEIF